MDKGIKMYKQMMALPKEVHEAMENALFNVRHPEKFPVDVQTFVNKVDGHSEDDYAKAMDRHILSIKMSLIYSKESKSIIDDLSENKLYQMSGFLEQMNRMPEIGDRFIIVRGKHYFQKYINVAGYISQLKLVVNPK